MGVENIEGDISQEAVDEFAEEFLSAILYGRPMDFYDYMENLHKEALDCNDFIDSTVE